MFTDVDRRMMQRALELAARGRYSNHPNPRVGCVIADGERVIGEGWHRKSGEPHAEPNALAEAGEAARGSTAYVTLEPHSFHGRTPPCTEKLVRAQVKRVVCATLDPNPKVNGEGVRQLQEAGVQVDVGLMKHEARELNLGFEKRMLTGCPRVVVKIGASLDGRVALASGESQWITGEAARADVQRQRAAASAVLTGVGTVLADDPSLNVRDASLETLGRQPLRVIIDTHLRTPASARMLKLGGETVILTASGDAVRRAALTAAGARIISAEVDAQGRLDLKYVLRALGERECNDVLVEAGSTLVGELLRQRLIDELIVYLAPLLLGPDARPMASFPLLERLADAQRYTLLDVQQLGADARLRLRRDSHESSITDQ